MLLPDAHPWHPASAIAIKKPFSLHLATKPGNKNRLPLFMAVYELACHHFPEVPETHFYYWRLILMWSLQQQTSRLHRQNTRITPTTKQATLINARHYKDQD
ncbi:hypothetical protein [Spongorhabdus nitratireducens]